MHAERFVDINASASEIYGLAQDVASWQSIWLYYRWVKLLCGDDRESIV